MADMRTTFGALGVLVCTMAIGAAEEPKKVFDAEKLVGDWEYVSGVRAGGVVEKDHLMGKVTFMKDKVIVPAGPTEKFVMVYKIDGSKTPATIDIEIKEGPVNEGKSIGLIELDDDTLKLIYVIVEDDKTKRPTKFESTKDNGAFLFTLKRAKK